MPLMHAQAVIFTMRSCVIKRRLSNFCLQDKTATARGKCDNDDLQCRDVFQLCNSTKKREEASQPLTIKAKPSQINMRISWIF